MKPDRHNLFTIACGPASARSRSSACHDPLAKREVSPAVRARLRVKICAHVISSTILFAAARLVRPPEN
jgi:hypothetical protein